MPYDHVERSKFEGRYAAALESGRVAVPFFGRGVKLYQNCIEGDIALLLDRKRHLFHETDYCLVQSSVPADFEIWEVVLIDRIVDPPPLAPEGATLYLTGVTRHAYPEGTYVWPLLFGRLIPEEYAPLNATRARYRVTVKSDQRPINASAFDTFEEYEGGPVSSGQLNGGSGWAGPWQIYSV